MRANRGGGSRSFRFPVFCGEFGSGRCWFEPATSACESTKIVCKRFPEYAENQQIGVFLRWCFPSISGDLLELLHELKPQRGERAVHLYARRSPSIYSPNDLERCILGSSSRQVSKSSSFGDAPSPNGVLLISAGVAKHF